VPAPESQYVDARQALLDVLDALGPQRMAVTLVGAQAIYLRTGESDLETVAPYTTDADLSFEPAALDPAPDLTQILTSAGLIQDDRNLGMWWLNGVEVDFMVPQAQAGPGSRGADLGNHGRRVARSTSGIEAVLEDRSVMTVGALDPGDRRNHDLWVAGEAALLIAKAHKIGDRSGNSHRMSDKDAHDILRLLRSTSTEDMASRLADLSQSDLAGEVTRQSLDLLGDLFASREATGAQMVARFVEGLADPDTEAMSAVLLSADLLEAVRASEDPSDA
jgi:hypothetical protein